MKKKILWAFFSTLIFALCFDFLFTLSRWKNLASCEPGTSNSVFTFAYSNLRNAATESCLSARSYSGMERTKLALPFESTPAMLLYWNGIKNSSNPNMHGRRILFGMGYPATVYAYDIDKQQILWKHDFFTNTPGLKQSVPINSSAPVIDHKNGRIYGSFIKEHFVGKRSTDSRLIQNYFSISLDGELPSQKEVDLSRYLLEKGTRATADTISKYLRCRTALAIDLDAENPKLYSGCSIVRAFSYQGKDFVHQASHQSEKGVRGILLQMELNATKGTFGRVRSFIPSALGSHPAAGVDAGIWMSGGAVTLLPENKVLFTTGNGYFLPEQKVFGCAVLRLDGKTMNLAKKDAAFFSKRAKDLEEAGKLCHENNIDLGSAGVSVIEKNGKYYAITTGKDGWIKSFDPLQLTGTFLPEGQELKVLDGNMYGQAPLLPSEKYHAISLAGGNEASGGSVWRGYAVAADRKLKTLWSITSKKPRNFNSSAVVTYTHSYENPIAFIPLFSGKASSAGFPAALQIVDIEIGRILDELKFEGSVHFSMPTIVDDKVFLPTTEHGIYVFELRKNFLSFYLHQSWFRKLLGWKIYKKFRF